MHGGKKRQAFRKKHSTKPVFIFNLELQQNPALYTLDLSLMSVLS